MQLLNPHIPEWNSFFYDLNKILKSNLDTFKNYIKSIENSKEIQDREQFREIYIIYKNFCIFINMQKVFEEMNEKNAFDFKMDILQFNERIELQKILHNLGLIFN